MLQKDILKSLIVRYDKTQAKLAKAMGISLSCLNAKINEKGGSEFKQSEISFIKERYKMTDEEVSLVFFHHKVS